MYVSAESEVSTTALCWTAKFLLPSFSRHLLCLVLCNAKGSCALVGYCAVKEVMLEDWSSHCVVLVAAAAAVVIWWWWFFKGQVYDECIIEYTQCHPLSCHYCCLWKCALPVSQPASQSVVSLFASFSSANTLGGCGWSLCSVHMPYSGLECIKVCCRHCCPLVHLYSYSGYFVKCFATSNHNPPTTLSPINLTCFPMQKVALLSMEVLWELYKK